jgi:hypothetical protein
MDTHTTLEELLEVVFSMPSMPRLYNKIHINNQQTQGMNDRVTRLAKPSDSKTWS